MTRPEFVAAMSAAIEEVALEEAARRGFNVKTEKHGLMRAMMMVWASKELFAEAVRRGRERLERDVKK